MRRFRELLVLVLLLGIGLAAGSAGTWADWAAATQNTGNSVATGTVALSDSDNGSSVFVFSGISPGPQPSRCVLVTNAGTVGVDVALTGTVSGALKDHMTIKVTRGAKNATCASPGAGTVLYDGELNTFPSSGTSLETTGWGAGDKHPYVFELTLRNDPAAQGQTASVGMRWDAR